MVSPPLCFGGRKVALAVLCRGVMVSSRWAVGEMFQWGRGVPRGMPSAGGAAVMGVRGPSGSTKPRALHGKKILRSDIYKALAAGCKT